jgi:inner membrane protein
MASPIGHALAGYAVYEGFTPDRETGRRKALGLCVLMAIAPDFDFIPGILLGSPAFYHQGISHSIGFGLAVSLMVAGVMTIYGGRFSTVFRLAFLSYTSHLVIDIFAPDGRPPYGLPLLWPLTDHHFISPAPVFLGVHHSPTTDSSILEWLTGIFSLHNVRAIAVEIVLIGPVSLLAVGSRRGYLSFVRSS